VFVRCDLSFVGGLCFVVADFVFESSEKKLRVFLVLVAFLWSFFDMSTRCSMKYASCLELFVGSILIVSLIHDLPSIDYRFSL
jgi:hypothetical protein